jgi:RNA polymerase sigma factor (sigma-70 family)
MKALPNYRYTPDERGHFRNYLIGILSHKAIDIIKKDSRETKKRTGLKAELETGLRMQTLSGSNSSCNYQPMHKPEERSTPEDEAWKTSVMEAAAEQLLADTKIQAVTREIFRHVAMMHESPESVAKMFGTTRNNVDQIKKRMIGKLTELIRSMTAEFNGF